MSKDEGGRRARGARGNEKGIALVFALLGMLVLSMIAASLLFVTSSESQAAFNYKAQMQASYVANVGVQQAIDWYMRTYAPYLDSTTGHTETLAYNITGIQPLYGGNPVVLGPSGNFPGSSILGSFNSMRSGNVNLGNASGTYTISNATLLYHDRALGPDGVTPVLFERWELTSTGRVGGALGDSVVQETSTIERFFLPLFNDAIRGRCTVDLGGNITTDSYYSTAGAYGGTNVYTGGDAQASVGSNSLISSVGAAGVINGNAYWGTSVGSCPGGEGINNDSIVQGQIIQAPGIPFPAITPTFPTTNSSNNQCSGNQTHYFQPNTTATYYNECDPNGNNLVVLCVPAASGSPATNPQTFFFNTIRVDGSQQLQLKRQNPVTGACDAGSVFCTALTPCAPAKLYVNVTLELLGGGFLGQTPGDPTLMSIFYSGTNDVRLGGSTAFYGTIYAPDADIEAASGATVYGAISGNNVDALGNMTVHYDLALQRKWGFVSRFRVLNQTRTVF